MVLSQCPVCAEHQALCCDGTEELRGALPLPGLCFAAGISISAAGGYSLLTLWLHPYFLGSSCSDRNACFHLECCEAVLGFLLLLALLGRL